MCSCLPLRMLAGDVTATARAKPCRDGPPVALAGRHVHDDTDYFRPPRCGVDGPR